jgi:predicted ATP-grasp superfamily ATP-dependent carboligase
MPVRSAWQTGGKRRSLALSDWPSVIEVPSRTPHWKARRSARADAPTSLDAVVLDAGLRQSLASVRSLGRAGLHVGAAESARERAPAAFWSRWCVATARLAEPTHPNEFVDGLLSLLDERPTRVVMPANDGSIDALVARRSEVERRAAVALASGDGLEIALDKARTLEVARDAAIACPRSRLVVTSDATDAAVDEIGLPAVVKPTRSWVHSGTAVGRRLSGEIVRNSGEAQKAVGQIVDNGGVALVQEWVCGRREAVSVFTASGRRLGQFAQVAHRTRPVLGGSSVVRESIPMPPDLAADAWRLVEAIGLDGYAEVEFRRDATGRALLMEVNPRLSASVELAVRAGIDFPMLVYRWIIGEHLEPFGSYRTGVRMRWLGGDLEWLAETLRAREHPDAMSRSSAAATFLRDFARPSAYDFADRHDVVPGVVAAGTTVPRLMRGIGRQLTHRMRRAERRS